MQDKVMKMLMSKKKEGKTLSDSDKKAKLSALQGMRGMAHQMMGDKLKNLKKVTVASDSKEGLKAGLHKAEDLASQEPGDEERPMGQDPNMYKGGSAYAEGGMAGLNNLPEDLPQKLEHDPGSTDYSDDEQGKMPQEFDTDMDHVTSEHTRDNEPRRFDQGGEMPEEAPESLDELVQEAPEDPDQLDKLIQMLEEKKQKLASK